MNSYMKQDLGLPKGWTGARVGDIVQLINGRAFKPNEWAKDGLPIVRIQNLNNHEAKFNYCNFKVEQKYIINNGQLLFAWSGTPGTSFGAHIWNKGKAILNQHIFRVETNEKYVDKHYLKYALNRNLGEYISKAHGAAGLAHITKDRFVNAVIVLPPINEQKRIVSKLEELFTNFDAGIGYLKKIQIQLRQYRRAVLKYAFEGKLTEKWREGNRNEIEHTIDLFDKLKSKSEYKNRTKIDVVEYEKLPNTWLLTKLGYVCELISGQEQICMV
jgi:type I restriction enzyme, S subunit